MEKKGLVTYEETDSVKLNKISDGGTKILDHLTKSELPLENFLTVYLNLK